MSGLLHCLAAGKADCFLLELLANGESAVILLDGGSKNEPVTPLLPYLEERGIRAIDLLVLTHLHQDHQGYLGDVAASLPVRRAVLPYPPIPLEPGDLVDAIDEERQNDIAVFNRMWGDLRRQGCPVETAFPLAVTPFRFGPWSLDCLYPTPGISSPVYEALCQMRGKPADVARELYESVRLLFNGDSSIWLLAYEGEPAALFCGDSFHESLVKALDGRAFTVPIVKLSHHGRNDKGNLYFVDERIRSLEPRTVILTSSRELAELHRDEWRRICPAASLLITGEQTGSAVIPLRETHRNEEF